MGRNLAERGLAASAGYLLFSTQKKKLENWWWIWVWVAILKPQINGKYSEKRETTTTYT